MESATTLLRHDHRALEALLDEVARAIRAGADLVGTVGRAAGCATGHYRREQALLDSVAEHSPGLAAKIAGQHAEAVEIASAVASAYAAGHAGDVLSLARRFYATAQHNVIEEERDLFPLADRCLDEIEQARIARLVSSEPPDQDKV